MGLAIKLGDVFGEWTVIDGPFIEYKRKRWYCYCECGAEALVNDYDLKSEKSTQCRTCSVRKPSLSRRDRPYGTIKQPHRKRLLDAVQNAISRCTNPEHSRYDDWGGRGIKIHAPWLEDQYLFVEYLATLTGFDNQSLLLDRIDNDGDYAPDNLQFVTRSESQLNRRTANNGYRYYMTNGFASCFKRFHDKGVSFKSIGDLYCENQSTIRNCVRELETGYAFGS